MHVQKRLVTAEVSWEKRHDRTPWIGARGNTRCTEADAVGDPKSIRENRSAACAANSLCSTPLSKLWKIWRSPCMPVLTHTVVTVGGPRG
jgi:hypothetical protein